MSDLQRKLVLMCAVLVHGMAATTWASALRVDFNSPGRSGAWSLGSPPGWSFLDSTDLSGDTGSKVFGAITVTLTNETTDGHGSLGISYNSYSPPVYTPSGLLAALVQDHLYIHDSLNGDLAKIKLHLSGLEPSRSYNMTTWHNSGYDHLAAPLEIDILVGPSETLVVDDFPQTRGVSESDDAAKAEFTVTTDGSGEVSVYFVSTEISSGPEAWPSNGACPVINGFELIDAAVASGPSPSDQSEDQCPGVVLSWEPGESAESHDVYIGTDHDDVLNATTSTAGIYQGNQVSNEFDTTPLSLQLGETYYWRIDEVKSSAPSGLWAGPVWSFTINDGKAYDPNPEEGMRVAPDATLTWSAGCLATSHDVYLGTSYAGVEAATTSSPQYKDNVSEPSYTPSLDPWTTYYWRIDEINGGTYKGDVWSFKTGLGGVLMYYKFDGIQGNDLPPTVIDDSGNNIIFTKYEAVAGGSVKYGESNPVIDASTASAEFSPEAGLFRIDTGEHDPLRLDGVEYTIQMWLRPDDLDIDDDIDLIEKHQGNSWRLYINDPPLDQDRAFVFVHAGQEKHMPDRSASTEWTHLAAVYDYYESNGFSMKFYLDGDLIKVGGRTGPNPPDTNTVCIGMVDHDDGGGGVVYSSIYDGLIDELCIHDVALTPCEFLLSAGPEYATCPSPENKKYDVDPNTVVLSWVPGSQAVSHDVYLGPTYDDVFNATTATAGIYQGNVDVNHYPESGTLELDLARTYYWRIDEVDGGVYKGQVWRFDTLAVVVDPNMRVWYKLDEESGFTARDSSGRAFNANVDYPGADPLWDADGGQFDGALTFDETDVGCPIGVLENLSTAISVSVWLKDAYDAYEPGSDNWVFSSRERDGSIVKAAVVEESTKRILWRAGDNSMDVLRWDLPGIRYLEDWHLWVFVKDEAADTMSIYFDGVPAKSKDTENDDVNDTLVNINGLELRLGADEVSNYNFNGSMDDFRLYDKALSNTEIEELFRGGDLESAWAPQPYDGQPDAQPDANLSWRPGRYAVEHDVYLGTDFDDVNDATTASVPTYRGRQDPCEYDPPAAFALNTTYYWRIDEVNDPCLWKGNVWKFTVANYVIIDNFESYDDDNKIWYTWVDLIGGSEVVLGTEPFSPAHTGDQSMLFIYDNSIKWDGLHYWSEVELPFGSPQDLTCGGQTNVLALYFYGDPSNDADDTEELYVGLTGSLAEVRYSDDAGQDNNDLKLEEWTEWNIPISDFIGVDPCAVTSLLIGFGDRNNTDTQGGQGIVCFDDIRLHPPRCMPEITKPYADLNDDCIVSWGDVAVIGLQWLRSDLDVSPVQDPGPTNLVGHWELEGNADDSSANNYHGSAEGDYEWIAGKIGSGAIDLSGGWVVVEDEGNTPLLRPTDQVSVAAWIHLDTSPTTYTRIVIKGRDDYETYATETDSRDGLGFLIRDANGRQGYTVNSDDELPVHEWVHIAGTYDSNEQAAYINGEIQASDTVGAIELFADANDGLGIGGRYGDTNLRFPGGFDDVRIYDRGLTRAEVAYLASEGTGQVLLDSEANLFWGGSPQVINISDLAVVLNSWLEEKLWP